MPLYLALHTLQTSFEFSLFQWPVLFGDKEYIKELLNSMR